MGISRRRQHRHGGGDQHGLEKPSEGLVHGKVLFGRLIEAKCITA
jgi:hypothetical protein